MLERLEKICINRGFIFRKNNTNGDIIDCFINDIGIQCKYMSLNQN